MGHMDDGGMGAGGWLLMSFVWLALLVLVVWAAAQLFPRGRPAQGSDRSTLPLRDDDPMVILDRRLARGEIDSETYDELRRRLADGTESGRT